MPTVEGWQLRSTVLTVEGWQWRGRVLTVEGWQLRSTVLTVDGWQWRRIGGREGEGVGQCMCPSSSECLFWCDIWCQQIRVLQDMFHVWHINVRAELVLRERERDRAELCETVWVVWVFVVMCHSSCHLNWSSQLQCRLSDSAPFRNSNHEMMHWQIHLPSSPYSPTMIFTILLHLTPLLWNSPSFFTLLPYRKIHLPSSPYSPPYSPAVEFTFLLHLTPLPWYSPSFFTLLLYREIQLAVCESSCTGSVWNLVTTCVVLQVMLFGGVQLCECLLSLSQRLGCVDIVQSLCVFVWMFSQRESSGRGCRSHQCTGEIVAVVKLVVGWM